VEPGPLAYLLKGVRMDSVSNSTPIVWTYESYSPWVM